jgi:Cu+-exporting ATPase
MEKTLKVSGMHCPSCDMLISEAVGDIAGAKVLSSSHKTGEVKVSFDSEATLAKIKDAIRAEGYKV